VVRIGSSAGEDGYNQAHDGAGGYVPRNPSPARSCHTSGANRVHDT